MKDNGLYLFCLEAKDILEDAWYNCPEDFWNQFYHLRYTDLQDKFPHKPFSSAQADTDFFSHTANYLSGIKQFAEEDIKNGGEYFRNYKEWIEKYKG